MQIAAQDERPPYVAFEIRAVEDRSQVIERGVYGAKDVDFALITPHGSRDRIERIVEDWFEQLRQQVVEGRWPQAWLDHYKAAYKAWKDGQEMPTDGTPIRNWSALSPAQVRACTQANVRAIEDLAVANEQTLRMIGMGARELKERAKQFLAVAEKSKVSEAINAAKKESENLRVRNESLEGQLLEMKKQIEILVARSIPQPA